MENPAMIDWGVLTLFLYMLMRMTGFVLFNPILGRRTIPALVKSGIILALTISVYFAWGGGAVQVPPTIVELSVRLLLELLLGYALGFVMEIFFYIPNLAGHVIDTQMGMAMASTYDPGSQISSTITSSVLNIMMVLLFFAANGHITLLRMLLESGGVVPFGQVTLGADVASAIAAIFVDCTLMAIKISLPVLAAELIGEMGMGVLIKAIPQVNAFVINIELKVVIGLFLVWLLIAPFSEFLLGVENNMLNTMREMLAIIAG